LAQDEAGERPKMDGGIFGRSPEAPQRSAQLLGKEKVLEKKLVGRPPEKRTFSIIIPNIIHGCKAHLTRRSRPIAV